jgi:hypothetical protein
MDVNMEMVCKEMAYDFVDLICLAKCVSNNGLYNTVMNWYFDYNSGNFLTNWRNGVLCAGMCPRIEWENAVKLQELVAVQKTGIKKFLVNKFYKENFLQTIRHGEKRNMIGGRPLSFVRKKTFDLCLFL